MANKRNREQQSWISKAKFEIEHEEELLECRRIVLKIVRYMKDNHLTQKELASRLNVTPQYINKFLHGQDLDLKISTVVRYGRCLGIKLIEVPGEKPKHDTTKVIISLRVRENAIQPMAFNYSEIVYEKKLPAFWS